MTSNEINYHPYLTKHVVKDCLLGSEDLFFLIDVGASGGIDSCWDSLGSYLHGVGFDPLVEECNRLNGTNKHPHFKYVPSYVISEKSEIDDYQTPETLEFHKTVTMFSRSSGWDAMKRMNMDYEKEIFNHNQEVSYAKDKVSLDRYCLEHSIDQVNFIKIDTDGFDYSVLRGAEKILQEKNTLGVFIECDMNAPAHPASNSFRNVDCFLSGLGYRLFDLSVWRYTKSALPGRFFYDIPAQTKSGQVSWGDALYFRDLVDVHQKGEEVSFSQILKMACLQEIFGLPDCAAELLVTFRDKLSSRIDVDQCLDLLTQDMNIYKSYEEHLAEFKKDPKNFFPTPMIKEPKQSFISKVANKILVHCIKRF